MTTATKRLGLFAGVVTLILACGGGETTAPPPPPPPAGVGSLQLTIPGTIVTGEVFPITILADNGWSGQVTLTSSAGTLSPGTVTLTGGQATVQATLRGHAGDVSITARAGTIQSSKPTLALSGQPAVRLEVHPSTFLLPASGATQSLVVRAFDAQGEPTSAEVSWESSNSGVVSVSNTGVAKAEASGGSAQVTARSGALRSQPALGLVTRPPQDAILVSDAQVAGGLSAVNPAAEYRPGWQYKVRLKGLSPTPTVGQILLASGEAPIGGRVVAATTLGSEVEVTLELLTLRQLLPELQINQTIALSDVRPATAPLLSRGPSSVGAGLAPEVEFGVGPFDCKASTTVGQVTLLPASGSTTTFDVTPTLSLDLVYSVVNGLQRFVVTGGVVGNLTSSPRLTAAVEGTFECKVQLGTIVLPLGGALSLFIASELPLGVGFAGEAKINLGDIGFDLQLSAGAQITLGIDCTAGCKAVSSASSSSSGSFEPKFPTLSGDFQVELAESGFAWAELAFGPPFIPNLKFEALEAKLGLKQEAKLAPTTVQANNPGYGSELRLAPFLKLGTSAKLANLTALLGITVAELKWEPTLPTLAQSPKGTLQITPAAVRATQPGQPGEKATFTVTLNPVSYLTRYAVQSVEIYRKKAGGGGPFLLDPAPLACAQIPANSSTQTTFTCDTDFPMSLVGEQTFYAFVKPTLFSIPVLLEIGPDAKAMVRVDSTSIKTKTTAKVLARTQSALSVLCSRPDSSTADSFTLPTQSCTSSGATVTSNLSYTRADGATTTLTTTGSTVANGGLDPAPVGHATLTLEFEITTAMTYEVTGFIEATDDAPIGAWTSVSLRGPTSTVFQDMVTGHPVLTENRTGTLAPGKYVLTLLAHIEPDGAGNGSGRGEARWDMKVVLRP